MTAKINNFSVAIAVTGGDIFMRRYVMLETDSPEQLAVDDLMSIAGVHKRDELDWVIIHPDHHAVSRLVDKKMKERAV